jgi:hypothetical protein
MKAGCEADNSRTLLKYCEDLRTYAAALESTGVSEADNVSAAEFAVKLSRLDEVGYMTPEG